MAAHIDRDQAEDIQEPVPSVRRRAP